MSKEYEFTRIIKENEGVIFKITTIYTNNYEDQKDLYQEIVYQLWKSYDSFKGNSKISTWMYRVGLNTAITRLKKEKRRGNQIEIYDVIMRQTEQYDTEFEERLKKLYAHIHDLNELDKGLILLLLEGKKYEEIAVITGLSPTNVGTRISRVKQKLKTKIEKK
ncbi:RNA polymerase sigma-70 factor (ECF subfamily) [Aquimarina sp. MAR_2010_214]|uniref:RNA polymerase sigma factor n=1 Tax=Aquimarina sp. MAR_2010_214 TaxID=1250026 RepID=UPI000C7051FE|nr:RNA polymerase sigma factor [Aquimarina sp. MAR_2010_214]PKV51243.1 RNA polymerase sigma-70 factor (ECF subfamily) [Aquimarina sp. MAR_2010_214]